MSSKYTWSSEEWDRWCKDQARKLREAGFQASTAGVTKMVYQRVILPNNVDLSTLLKNKIKVKRR